MSWQFAKKRSVKPVFIRIAAVVVLAAAATTFWHGGVESKTADNEVALTPIEELGKYVIFDKISTPKRMACLTCHQPETGGTGGVSGVNLHQVAITGANPHTVGNLKPPTTAYASYIKPFSNVGCIGGLTGYCGGNFWNGRAEGNAFPPKFPAGATKHIGEEIFFATDGAPLTGVQGYADYFGPTADQALNPMPNAVEQNIDRQAVCNHVKSAKYAELYKKVWGVDIDCSDTPVSVKAPDVVEEKAFDISFKRIMLAVCAWQASPDLNSFSSKRDIALADDLDRKFPLDGFTDEENLGHDLFYGTNESGRNNGEPNGSPKNARCSVCHISDIEHRDGTGTFERYSEDAYHNIGTPRNPEIPETFNTAGTLIDPDEGLAGHTGLITIDPPGPVTELKVLPFGFFKTAILRNVDKRPGNGFIKAYTHNGWFKSLESIVHFYNTAFLGNANTPYEQTTAYKFGVTRCPEGVETEKDALANNCWPAPASNTLLAIPVLVGNLGLTADEEAAIVAYMKTFTDSHNPRQPKPYKADNGS